MSKVKLYVPKLDELWFYEKMMSDPDTMSYNAHYDLGFDEYHDDTGCIDFPREQWDEWYADWVGQEPVRFFAYIKDAVSGEWVGNVNFHKSYGGDWYDMGIVLYAPFRGRGYSAPALRLMLAHAFEACGVVEIHNDFEVTREAALKTHLAVGFKEAGVTDGVVTLVMTKEDFEAHKDEA